jgi:hypothetical protein
VIGSTCTAALTPQSIHTVYYASTFAGADIGAKINAADAAAGGSPADIIVTAGPTSTVTTVPSISAGHRLILTTPLTWLVGPQLHNNTAIIGTGAMALQTIGLASNHWISSVNLSGIEISGVWFQNSLVPLVQGATILYCQTCNGITMRHNHVLGAGLIFTDSTATTYAGVNSGNLTTNVVVSDNFVDGLGSPTSSPVTLALFSFTSGVTASNNTVQNAEYNVQWWGGNAATDGIVLTNTRWASNINITGGSAKNVRAGFWGGMGQNVTVTGVTVDTCDDVGLDSESSTNVVFSGFTVHNCRNGGLAVFFSSQHVTFGPGVVTSDTRASALMALKNVSNDPIQETDVKVQNVKFNCLDTAGLCVLLSDPIGGFQFDDNEVDNAVLTFTSSNLSGIEISRNRFSYTFAPSSAFSAITIPGHVFNYKPTSVIAGNLFQSSVTQPAGTFAINAAITDFNNSDILYVRDNNTQGFTNDAKFIAASTNTGITPTFIFSGNNWGANSVTHTITGALGSFRFGGDQLPLIGITGALPGTVIAAGDCTNLITAIPGASTAMTATATPASTTSIGAGMHWDTTFVSAIGTITVPVCNTRASPITPASTPVFNVRVNQ